MGNNAHYILNSIEGNSFVFPYVTASLDRLHVFEKCKPTS